MLAFIAVFALLHCAVAMKLNACGPAVHPFLEGASPECAALVQQFNNGPCQSALRNAMQNAAVNVIDYLSSSTQQYCSRECAVYFRAFMEQSSVKCGADSRIHRQFLEFHNLQCTVDESTGENCHVQNLRLKRPYLQQHPELAVKLFQQSWDGAHVEDVVYQLNEARSFYDTLLDSADSAAVCTSCFQFHQQQRLLRRIRYAKELGAQSEQSSAVLSFNQALSNKLQDKCGNDWVSLDESRNGLWVESERRTGGVIVAGDTATAVSETEFVRAGTSSSNTKFQGHIDGGQTRPLSAGGSANSAQSLAAGVALMAAIFALHVVA
ncbi:hypothetical protein RI367_006453 [Sorochytrium milnesiophthora]